MLWFGIGDLSKVLIIALACFYPSFVNAYHGARATPTILVWSALNMGAGRGQIFRKVVLPGALPLVFAGVRVSLALSFILLFSTEMINARSGLGSLIRQAESSLAFDLMYVSIVAIAILGWASDRLLRAIRARVLAWQEATADVTAAAAAQRAPGRRPAWSGRRARGAGRSTPSSSPPWPASGASSPRCWCGRTPSARPGNRSRGRSADSAWRRPSACRSAS